MKALDLMAVYLEPSQTSSKNSEKFGKLQLERT